LTDHSSVEGAAYTTSAFQILKYRMILAPILLIPKRDEHDANFFVATDASRVGIVGVLLQEDTSESLRQCAY